MSLPQVGVVVLTQGNRPEYLRAAVDSVLAQQNVNCDIVCVGNGWEPEGLPAAVRPLYLPQDLGIPAGRNAGAQEVAGDLLLFLDDDARLADPEFLRHAVRHFETSPELGLVQPRVNPLDGSRTPSRWIPRLRGRGIDVAGPVFSVWEGAVVVRRSAFTAAGGWPGGFVYAHEGIELSWRIWDCGYQTWYQPQLVAEHPSVHPSRHQDYLWFNARNRVWLARRNLPLLLRVPYVLSWMSVQMLRTRSWDACRQWLKGVAVGLTSDPGVRRPMSWRTVVRMGRYGRLPVV